MAVAELAVVQRVELSPDSDDAYNREQPLMATTTTLVQLTGANCTYCIAETTQILASRPQVEAVRLSSSKGCVEIEHNCDDLAALCEVIASTLHGWDVASNGEILMMETSFKVMDTCDHSSNR